MSVGAATLLQLEPAVAAAGWHLQGTLLLGPGTAAVPASRQNLNSLCLAQVYSSTSSNSSSNCRRTLKVQQLRGSSAAWHVSTCLVLQRHAALLA